MKKFIYLIIFSFIHFHLLFSSCIPSFQQCGCSYQQPILSKSRIVGGYTAREHSWPWIVSIHHIDINHLITNSYIPFCGGTLINEKYVLTAAHCFYDIKHFLISNYFIIIGAHYINNTNPIRIKIKSIILHEKYDNNLFLNDIALLELSYKINFNNKNFGFICLPLENNKNKFYPYEYMNGIAVGWGRLKENGSTSNTLQQIQLPIISNKNRFCIEQTHDELTQFCAGFIQGGKDTCQGDSGGPLMIYNENTSTWIIAGITSYGYGCARAEKPGIYTRVSMYIDWINKHIHNSSQSLSMYISIEILLLLLYIVL